VKTTARADSLSGVAVTVEEQPRLWAQVRELAAAAGTEAPDEIWIDDRANAVVIQDTVLLGLVTRTRRLLIGAPLLLALSPAQLDAVLAHEFGHYSKRGRKSLPKAVEAVAGSQPTIAASERMQDVQRSYRFYLDQFLDAGLTAGLVPEPQQILGGFSALLAALPDEARAVDPGGRAIDLLDRADEVLASVGLRMLGARYEEASRADWDTIADAAARERSRSAAQPLIDAIHLMTGTAGTLTAFLDLVDAGHLETVRFRLLTPAQVRYAGAGDVALELARKALMTTLPPLVLAELGDAGVVRWTRSWSGEAPALVISPALSIELDAAYAALLAEVPSAEPLRRAVMRERVPADPGEAASAGAGTQAD
jgi:hypothetical protein